MGETLDKASVMPRKPAESADLGFSLRHGELLNCTYIVSAWVDPVF